MANTPFYASFKPIRSQQITVDTFINDNFMNFWAQFFEYLKCFQKPVEQRLFKNPIRDMIRFLKDDVLPIINKASLLFYKEQMIPDMKKCFLTLLNQNNIPEIKRFAYDAFIKIVTNLGQDAEKYTSGFAHYVFDFSFYSPALVFDISDEFKIAYVSPDQRGKAFEFSEFLDYVRNVFNENPNSLSVWWPYIQKHIIGVAYYSLTAEFYASSPDSVPKYGIDGLCPIDLQKLIIVFLTEICSKKIFFVEVLQYKNGPNYLFSILEQISIRPMIENEWAQKFIFALISLILENNEIASCIHTSFLSLLPKAMNALLNYLNFSFLIKNENIIEKVTKEIISYFSLLYCLHQNISDKISLVSQLVNWEGADSTDCTFHILTNILSAFITLKITDDSLWPEFVNGSKKCRINALSCHSNFAAFYSISCAKLFLSFDFNKLGPGIQLVKNLDNWTTNHGFWSSEIEMWNETNGIELYQKYGKEFVPIEIISIPEITAIRLKKLSISTWTKDDALQCMRAMFVSFKNKIFSEDEETQYFTYLVCASFISPLLKLTEVLPPNFEFDKIFLLREFLPFLNECVSPSVSNARIKFHALNILGHLICKPSTLPILNDTILADWYLTLRSYITSGTRNLKLTALTFACRSVLFGLNGSSILIHTIASNFEWYPNGEGERLSPKEVASALLSMNVVSEISEEIDFFRENENVKNLTKRKIIDLIKETITPEFRVSSLMNILYEEATYQRKEIIDSILNGLILSFKEKTIENIYNIAAITLILPEIEKTCPGFIEKLLTELLNAVSFREKEDEVVFVRFVEFIVDVLIYSSMIINVSQYLKKFEEIANTWKLNSGSHLFSSESEQRLINSLMYLTIHVLRFPYPAINFSASVPKPCATFGSTMDCILKINPSQLSSELPVGRFTWNFESIAPEPEIRTLSNDIFIDDQLLKVEDTDEQKAFSSKMADFVSNLYSEHLPKHIDDASLKKPDDFNTIINNTLSLTPNQFVEPCLQNLPPSSVGPSSTAFMSSLNFFDILETNRLFPVNNENSIEMVDELEYRHVIDVSFIYSISDIGSHFEDFKHGLGLLDAKTNNIVYADCRHQITFHNDKSKQSIILLWNEGFCVEEKVMSLDQKQSICIEITPQNSGLFNLSIQINKNKTEFPYIKEMLVSKSALPVIVLAQIFVISHIIDQNSGNVVMAALTASNLIRNKRTKEFMSNSILLYCAKTLLQNANQ